jgi:hypothetical protein
MSDLVTQRQVLVDDQVQRDLRSATILMVLLNRLPARFRIDLNPNSNPKKKHENNAGHDCAIVSRGARIVSETRETAHEATGSKKNISIYDTVTGDKALRECRNSNSKSIMGAKTISHCRHVKWIGRSPLPSIAANYPLNW